MGVRVIVRVHLVFKVLNFFLQPLDLFFETFDSLIIVGVLVALLCLSHISS